MSKIYSFLTAKATKVILEKKLQRLQNLNTCFFSLVSDKNNFKVGFPY